MYDLIGKVLFAIIIFSIVLSILALAVSRISLNRHVWLAGSFANILDFFYLPVKYVFYRFSDSRILDKWMVSLKNMAYMTDFSKTKKRIILAPHCMRALDCPAPSTRSGIKCIACGKCIFSQLKEEAEGYGYKLYIITGSSFVRHVLKSEPVDGVLLIACDYELNKVMRALKDTGVVAYGIPMENDGCYNTTVDHEKVLEILKSFAEKE